MNNYSKYLLPAIVCILICFALINFSSCDEGPIDPIVEYGRRDYIWEEDTLDVPLHSYISYRDIVGNSSNDVWLGNLDPGLWHYNGEQWELTEFPSMTPSALWLFEDNTLWVGTRESLILKGENSVWTENYQLSYEGFDWIDVFGMYGKEKNDIYAVGIAVKAIIPGEEHIMNGIILHYNGSSWEFLDLSNLEEVILHKIYYQENIDTYFIKATKNENGVRLDKLFTFDGNNLTEIISTPGSISLSKLNGIVYINNNFEVYKYINKKLVLWKDFTGTEFVSNFKGRSENDFFNNSKKGIGHYNGKDYVTIYPTHLDISTKIIFENEVFITAKSSDFKHYIVIHGILKEEEKME